MNVCQSCGATEIEVGEAGRPSVCVACGSSMISNRSQATAILPARKRPVELPVRQMEAHFKKHDEARARRHSHSESASFFHRLLAALKSNDNSR